MAEPRPRKYVHASRARKGTIFVPYPAAMSHCKPPFARTFSWLLLAGMAGLCAAQADHSSLTKDFKKLSAKERSRIAARETAEAAKDSSYQAIMRQAEADFQAKRYQEALAAYKRARIARPYNVYPKVKIEDLQVLIAKQEKEQPEPVDSAPAIPATMPDTARPVPQIPVVPPSQPEPLQASPQPQPAKPAGVPPAPEPAPAPPPEPVRQLPPAQAPPAAKPPLELGERVYKEAGAVVTERTVEDEGKAVVYKRVAHAWGQTFYFKDGQSIPEREWRERFSE
jgi:hypothetical protein